MGCQTERRNQCGENKQPEPQWQADINWPVVHALPPEKSPAMTAGLGFILISLRYTPR